MLETNVQKLSAPETIYLMTTLSCFKDYLTAGNENCTAARHSAGLMPEDVGKGDNTMPDASHRFATVCETCPVLLTAFAHAFARPH